jgi:Ca2+-transporting ATPase
MGKTATEVTREAAEMVLATDDLSGVVGAIREGRIIYTNIRKTVVYLLGGNASELVFMLFAAAMGWPLPLTPVQLLWVNLLCEPLPGLALAVDPEDGNVLTEPPRPPDEPLLGREQWTRIALVAALHTVVVLGVYGWALQAGTLAFARTLTFTTFVFSVLFRSFAARSPWLTFWEVGALGNLRLLGVVVLSGLLQLVVLYLPTFSTVFAVEPLPASALGLALGLALVPVTCEELAKLVMRASRHRRGGRGLLH